MATTRYKGETAGERLDLSGISDSDMIQLRHKPGTIDDADKGISKSQLLSCPFGVSDTAAATAAKAASLTDSNPDFTLVSGREVVVCFTAANTASNPTLNFAGSGAIPIYYPNGAVVGDWPADTWMHLKYFYATVGNTTIQRWILLSPLFDNVSSVGGSGKYISAIEQINGKLVATASDIATSVTSGNGAPVSSSAVFSALRNVDNFVVINSSVTETLGANAVKGISFSFTVPQGYATLCLAGLVTSGPSGLINWYSYAPPFNKTGTFSATFYFRNYSSSQQSGTLTVYLLCYKIS